MKTTKKFVSIGLVIVMKVMMCLGVSASVTKSATLGSAKYSGQSWSTSLTATH